MSREISPVKQKILLLLLGGLAFGYSYTPQRQIRLIKEVSREWKKINERKLKQEVQALYRSKLVDLQENPDGTFNMLLTDKGKCKILNYHFAKMKINPLPWDKKWRIVVFDVPEKIRKGRDALRDKLKTLGFYELQKSTFIFPYPCEDEINFLIEFFDLRKYVRYGVLESIDSDLHLRKIFRLT